MWLGTWPLEPKCLGFGHCPITYYSCDLGKCPNLFASVSSSPCLITISASLGCGKDWVTMSSVSVLLLILQEHWDIGHRWTYRDNLLGVKTVSLPFTIVWIVGTDVLSSATWSPVSRTLSGLTDFLWSVSPKASRLHIYLFSLTWGWAN
jgi:hypothetical protein